MDLRRLALKEMVVRTLAASLNSKGETRDGEDT